MAEAVRSDTDFPSEHKETLISATGRSDLVDALHWIAEKRTLSPKVDGSRVLVAVVAAADVALPGSDAALRTVVRSTLQSTFDTSADLVLTNSVVPPHSYQAALANVATRTVSGTLADVGPGAVFAAQVDDSLVIEALALSAGLSWRDLQDRCRSRGKILPGESDGLWNPDQVTSAFGVIDDVVHGRIEPQLVGAVAARPLELLLDGSTGWGEIERLRTSGVSYGTLLAQRDVGSAWSAHRNRSNSEISKLMVRRVLAALDKQGVEYWSTEGDAPVKRTFLGRQVCVTGKPPGQLSIVTRQANGQPGYAILAAIARDGGTARKTGATLLKLSTRFSSAAVLVLVGTGWADRGESDDLVRAYGGRLYTEHTLGELAHLTTLAKFD